MSETEAVVEMQTFEVVGEIRLSFKVRVAAEDEMHLETVMSELTTPDLTEFIYGEDVDVMLTRETTEPPQLIGEKW